MSDIQHEPAARRFSTTVDGHSAEVDYDLRDSVMTITHTRVPEAIGGRGVAGDLTRAAFEFAKREGIRVQPLCSYAVAWSKRHPEYEDLLV